MKFTADSIHFYNLAEFSQFTHLIGYETKQLRSKDSIMVLANDVYNDKNALLSPANTKVDADLFRKLRTSVSDKVSSNLDIYIKKCPEIAAKLMVILRASIALQFESSSILPRVGKTLFLQFEDRFLDVLNSAFKNTQLTYAFFNENNVQLYSNKEFKGFNPTITEGITKALLSVGVELSTTASDKNQDFLQHLFISQLIITLTKIEITANLEANATSSDYDLLVNTFLENCLQDLEIDHEIILAGKSFFHTSDKNGDAVLMTETAVRLIKNIEVIEEFYRLITSNESGYVNVNSAVAKLYKKCYHKELDEDSLKKLAVWLHKQSIFRLNKTLHSIENMCNRGEGGKSNALYYPKHGNGIPTMFICSVNDESCPHISPAFRRINVAKRMEGISPGSYTKCSMLSAGLHKYYEKDLENIKEEQNRLA
ncbi:MAG: hypothetical protein DWQ05_07990 [Calditrichaeota bacterium]|nr:MAG: hypothetical protein DWQ05_07990 [Calditrichota bacterium]